MEINYKNVIGVALSVAVILLAAYLSTAFFLTGELGNKKTTSKKTTVTTTEEVSKYSNMILASKVFDISDKNYKVLFFSKKGTSNSFETIITNYDSMNKGVKLYKVDTDNAMNKFVLSDTENKNATNSRELKIKAPTLITIDNGRITNYVSNYDEILEALAK